MRILLLVAALMSIYPSTVHASEGVILLHGMCRTSASMSKMVAALQSAGYTVLNVDYPSRTASTEKLADGTITQALSDPTLAGCTQIHFVTHSMGGILVRSYFTRHTDTRLGRVVMLGPPNQGSEVVDHLRGLALFRVINGPAGDELGTAVTDTPAKLGPVNFPLGVIAGDRSINWINSLMISGKNDGKVSVERTKVAGMTEQAVVHATHPYLMRNARVIVLTLRFLKTASFVDDPASKT